jgi:urea carboxylase
LASTWWNGWSGLRRRLPPLATTARKPQGASIQVRLYAEDPARTSSPRRPAHRSGVSPGMPRRCLGRDRQRGAAQLRPDAGQAHRHRQGPRRPPASCRSPRSDAATAWPASRPTVPTCAGGWPRPCLLPAADHAHAWQHLHYRRHHLDVLEPGVQTTVQDWPGRTGYWDVGVPPSGPMDDLPCAWPTAWWATPEGTPPGMHHERPDAALQLRHGGCPHRRAHGADAGWRRAAAVAGPHRQAAGSVLKLGAVQVPARAYLAVRGGLDVPDYLGSRATFTLGQFGGHAGRTLRLGDVLHVGCHPGHRAGAPGRLAPGLHPPLQRALGHRRALRPHGAPDFFTDGDIECSSPPTGKCTTTPAAPACA